MRVANGVAMLTLITAAGCSVTAVIAAFLAANPGDPIMAAAHALAIFGYGPINGLFFGCGFEGLVGLIQGYEL